MRTENQDRIARIEEGFAKELLENFGAGTDHDILGGDVDAIFLVIVGGDGIAKTRQPQRSAVMSLIGVDGVDPRLEALLVLGNGLSPICKLDNIFALRLELAGDGENVKRGFGG